MLKLVKAPKAEADLVDIWLYIAEDQPVNADLFLDRLNESVIALAKTPGMGVDRPDIAEEIKSFPVGNFVLFYRVKPSELELVRVISASRDIDNITW